MTRYKVMPHSQTGHCCFEFTVVDTTQSHDYTGRDGIEHFEPLCECFNEDDANRIAAALNAQEPTAEPRWQNSRVVDVSELTEGEYSVFCLGCGNWTKSGEKVVTFEWWTVDPACMCLDCAGVKL